MYDDDDIPYRVGTGAYYRNDEPGLHVPSRRSPPGNVATALGCLVLCLPVIALIVLWLVLR